MIDLRSDGFLIFNLDHLNQKALVSDLKSKILDFDHTEVLAWPSKLTWIQNVILKN